MDSKKLIDYKKVGVFGLGLSGFASFNFFKNRIKEIMPVPILNHANKFKDESTEKPKNFFGSVESEMEVNVICWDDSETMRNKLDKKYLFPISDQKWKELDIIIVSPGISDSHQIFTLAREHNIRISSDIEIFLQINYDSKIIAISGTNGKSTTTALIAHILQENNLDYHIAGNIGVPVLELPMHAQGYVLELSSFQLDLLPSINTDIAVLLNITPDHMDRYGNYEKYIDSKTKILINDGIKIIGVGTEHTKLLYEKLKKSDATNIISINTKNDASIVCNRKIIKDNFFDDKIYNIPKHRHLNGMHNAENIAASFAVCRACGISGDDIIKNLTNFVGLKHRMQFVGMYKHISFYNDSKATNTNSALSSLSALDNILWLAGGVFKEKNLLSIDKSIKNIKKAYLFGESRLLFAECLDGKLEYVVCSTMKDAFNKAVEDVLSITEKVNILLAPACASFDQFKDFADRGNNFIDLYNEKFQ